MNVAALLGESDIAGSFSKRVTRSLRAGPRGDAHLASVHVPSSWSEVVELARQSVEEDDGDHVEAHIGDSDDGVAAARCVVGQWHVGALVVARVRDQADASGGKLTESGQ